MTFTSLIRLIAIASIAGIGASASAQITIPTVPVGDPGNNWDSNNGRGSVWYTYNIGTFEVTAGQYAAFLNAVARSDPNNLYTPDQARTDYGSGIARTGTPGSYTYTVAPAFVNRPVNYVSFWDACRFVNWLHNGQPTGAQNASTTEDGAYTLTAAGISANTITRNEGWRWAVTSDDEWYKAAFYKGGGTSAGYWFFPTRSNTPPTNDLNDLSGNSANYRWGPGAFPIQSPYFTTVVGQFANSPSPHGTFDMAGNVWEWTERITSRDRVLRGGSFMSELLAVPNYPVASYGALFHYAPQAEYFAWGFRVVQKPPCAADFDGSAFVDADDFVFFLEQFTLGCTGPGQDVFGPNPSCVKNADFDGTSFIDADDFVAFLAAFQAGC
ncbi:MAG: SUMF1/EgtB/PvdO family nonheme iron enzyme [Planctomycetota bacterium]|nr:SUMF1/EgtB/PvdO family nonheme iron enzyme [Planctomycetota bacterium]